MKNKNTCYLVLFLFIGVSLFSCKKENINDEQEQNNSTTSCRIKEITYGNGEKTIYTYNSDNKLTQISNGPTDPMTMNFTYDANGHIKTMQVLDNIGTNATTTFTYTNDLVTSAHVTDTGSQYEANMTYNYSSGKLHDVEVRSLLGVLFVKTIFYYNEDNVSKMEEYSLNVSGNLSLSNTVTYQYDNKKNPFYEFGIAAAVINVGYASFASKNNITQTTQTNSGTGNESISYQYNSNDYPSEATGSISGNSIFTYYSCN